PGARRRSPRISRPMGRRGLQDPLGECNLLGGMFRPIGGRCSGFITAALLLVAACQGANGGGEVVKPPPGPTPPTSQQPELPVAPPGATPLDCSEIAPGAAEA